MELKVSKNKESYQKSLYRVGNSRTDLTFKKVTAELYGNGDFHTLAEAENYVSQMWVEYQQSSASSDEREKQEEEAKKGLRLLTAALPSISRRLSTQAVDLLSQYMGYHSDNNGVDQWFYRVGEKGRVWDTCSTPIPAMADRDEGRLGKFQKEWFKLHSASQVRAWVVADPDTGELSPLIDDQRLLEIALSQLKEEDRLKVKNLARAWFLKWADKDFDPKFAPYDYGQETPVDFLPALRQIFAPSGSGNWAATLMKEEPQLQIRMPQTITNNPEVDAFTYVDIGSLHDGDTPAWDKWIETIHPVCREIFMAAVFAPMHDKCRHRKLVWMRSQGYDGKSTFFNALNRWSGGKLTKSFGGHNINSDFGLESLIGARILLWGDSQHENALSTNAVHNITGGDLVTINRKNEKAIQYRFNSMLFVASNSRPQLKSWARNETTRLLYIPFIEPKEEVLKEFALTDEEGRVMRQSDGTPIFKGSNLEEKLLEEMPKILYKCALAYKKYCPEPYRDLAIPQAVYDLMLEENEHEDGHEFASFVAHHLKFGPKLSCCVKEVHDKFRRYAKGRVSNHTLSDLFRFLERNYAIDKRKGGSRGSQKMMYWGCDLSVGGGDSTLFDGEE